VFDAYDNEYTVAITQSNQEFPNYPLNFRVSTIKLMVGREEGSL